MRKRTWLCAAPLVIFFGACSPGEPPATQASAPSATSMDEDARSAGDEQRAPDGHTSRLAVDWAGTYSGILPCADCAGMETTLTLHEDGTFDRSVIYVDKSPIPVTDSGAFQWAESGNNISISSNGGEKQIYQVGENQLFHLNRDGERISGNLASQYVLQKHVRDPAIEDRNWQLVELRGDRTDSWDLARDAALALISDDSVASGNTSCNTFSGRYAIKSGEMLSFGRNMAVTMMSCPEMNVESIFLDVLRKTNRYSLSEDGGLILYDADTAPLARFEPGEAEERQAEQ